MSEEPSDWEHGNSHRTIGLHNELNNVRNPQVEQGPILLRAGLGVSGIGNPIEPCFSFQVFAIVERGFEEETQRLLFNGRYQDSTVGLLFQA